MVWGMPLKKPIFLRLAILCVDCDYQICIQNLVANAPGENSPQDIIQEKGWLHSWKLSPKYYFLENCTHHHGMYVTLGNTASHKQHSSVSPISSTCLRSKNKVEGNLFIGMVKHQRHSRDPVGPKRTAWQCSNKACGQMGRWPGIFLHSHSAFCLKAWRSQGEEIKTVTQLTNV